jgi:hypothetical protein
VSKIGRAVEGIDVPAKGRFALPPAPLLGHNRMLGEMGPQAGHDGLFGPPVRLRHNVHFPLVADLDRPVEFGKQNGPRFPRRFDGHIQK